MDITNIETMTAAVIFALTFIFGPKLHRPGEINRRSLLSFAAGASVAYIFVHLIPELEAAREVFMEGANEEVSNLARYTMHLTPMAGFIFFYGLDQFVIGLRSKKESVDPEDENALVPSFWIHVVILGTYSWLVSYLMVNSLEEGSFRIGLYAVAMFMHFLTVSNGLRREYKKLYDRIGAFLLGACSIAGWVLGMILVFPKPVIALLLGLIAGGVIANTLLEELPKEKEGRFLPFLAGSVFYTALLLVSV